MKRFLFVITFILIVSSANSQGFTKALGIRGGYTSGFGYRVYTNDVNSYKLSLGIRDQGVQLYAMKEFYKYDLFDFAYQIVFYYGFGVHGGYESWEVVEYQNNIRRTESKAAAVAGVDVLLGFEYVFDAAPVSAGIEVKPFLDILGRDNFNLIVYDFAFTVNYLF